MRSLKKVLIANRGEIAIRINRAARDIGIRTVAIYSDADEGALHTRVADEALCIGNGSLRETYLNVDKIVQLAIRTGCDAIHPGYGFLAENPRFPEACEAKGITFIGPSGKVMSLMGNKIRAREFIRGINIPLVEGVVGKTARSLIDAARGIPLPLLLKAAGGGGGKGMRVVREEKELAEAIETTRREAATYFGDGTVYIEKYLEDPRHIEFQILGDHFGNVVHLYERECSIQRRYQKIIEESPSPTLNPALRRKMGNAAVRIGKEIGYNNAGTIEFLVDRNLNYYFLEMNTRIQVEHPVTEMITGLDLVKEQFYISAGNPLRFSQKEIQQQGHAIEARIYAEDPANEFLPSPGIMSFYREPEGPDIRVDSCTDQTTEIKSFFDPMISKLIVYDKDRKRATGKLKSALRNYVIHGLKTNIPYLIGLVSMDDFLDNRISTSYCDAETSKINLKILGEKQSQPAVIPLIPYLIGKFQREENIMLPPKSNDFNIWEYIGYWRNIMKIPLKLDGEEKEVIIHRLKAPDYEFEMNGKIYPVQVKEFSNGIMNLLLGKKEYKVYISERHDRLAYVTCNGYTWEIKRGDYLPEDHEVELTDEESDKESGILTSPMPGKVIKINARKGIEISKGQVVLVVEAMKMENNIIAKKDGIVSRINVSVGQMVEGGAALVVVEECE